MGFEKKTEDNHMQNMNMITRTSGSRAAPKPGGIKSFVQVVDLNDNNYLPRA